MSLNFARTSEGVKKFVYVKPGARFSQRRYRPPSDSPHSSSDSLVKPKSLMAKYLLCGSSAARTQIEVPNVS